MFGSEIYLGPKSTVNHLQMKINQESVNKGEKKYTQIIFFCSISVAVNYFLLEAKKKKFNVYHIFCKKKKKKGRPQEGDEQVSFIKT